MIELEERMRGEMTCPEIIQSISTSLRAWRECLQLKNSDRLHVEGVKEVIIFQNRIGQKSVLEGRIGYRWARS